MLNRLLVLSHKKVSSPVCDAGLSQNDTWVFVPVPDINVFGFVTYSKEVLLYTHPVLSLATYKLFVFAFKELSFTTGGLTSSKIVAAFGLVLFTYTTVE